MRNLCESCTHNDICMYRDKLVDIGGEIDALVEGRTRNLPTNIFDAGINCKHYLKIVANQR